MKETHQDRSGPHAHVGLGAEAQVPCYACRAEIPLREVVVCWNLRRFDALKELLGMLAEDVLEALYRRMVGLASMTSMMLVWIPAAEER
jgi:hypothetical protein